MYARELERTLFEQCVPRDKITDDDRKELYSASELSETQKTNTMSADDIAKIADAVIQRLGAAQRERNNPTPEPPTPSVPTPPPITNTINNLS